MGDRVKNIRNKIKEFFGKLAKGVKIAILLVLVLTIGGIVALIVFNANRPYTVLFTGLAQEDMTAVLTYLNANGATDYKIEGNDTILVRQDKALSLKAAILQEGYPTSGYAYGTYLDNVGMLSSESDRKKLSTFDLQDQLRSVIRSFEGVRDARVTVSTTSNTRYILSDAAQSASAAVQVEMLPGKVLTDKMVNAIRNYVTHSVEGLSFNDVSISDTEGNVYSGGDESSISDSANTKLKLQDQINKQVRSSVMQVLTPYFGLGNVSISVFSEVDTSRTYTEALQYLEPEWASANRNGRGIIGSWVWDSGIVRGENSETGGTAGTGSNADLNEYVINEGDVTGNEQEVGTAGEIDYLVGTQRTQRDGAGGVLTDLMVAVSINRDAMENDLNRADWIPLIARAAGIGTELQNEKIAIQVYPFYVQEIPEEEPGPPTLMDYLPWWAVYAAIAGGIVFLILLIIILIITRKIKKKVAEKKEKKAIQEAAEQEMRAKILEEQKQQQQLLQQSGVVPAEGPPEDGADIMGMNTERTMELRKEVRAMAEENPALAASLIKQWLHGGEDD